MAWAFRRSSSRCHGRLTCACIAIPVDVMGDWLGLADAVPVDVMGDWLGLAEAVLVDVMGD